MVGDGERIGGGRWNLRSLDQIRAAAAYRAVASADDKAVDMARRLPSMFQINGMLATWAFLIAKSEKQATPLPALLAHLRMLPELQVPETGDPKQVFLHWVGGGRDSADGISGTTLRHLTEEALAFAGWLKRAAEARGNEGAADDAGT